MHDINSIQVLKESPFSLAEIKDIMHQDLRNDELLQIMKEKHYY